MKTIEIIKEVAGMKVGTRKTVDVRTANNIINRGLAKEVVTTKELNKIVTKTESNEGNSKKKQPAKRSKSSNGKTPKK